MKCHENRTTRRYHRPARCTGFARSNEIKLHQGTLKVLTISKITLKPMLARLHSAPVNNVTEFVDN